jgi:acetyltransferase-like isoleucine patch superfamily enzyme
MPLRTLIWRAAARLLLSAEARTNWLLNRLWFWPRRQLLGSCGAGVTIDRSASLTYRNLYFGNDVLVNRGAIFWAAESKIYIGNKCLFGPDVVIMGGNHNIHTVGKFIYDVTQKAPADDRDVIIEDDVWVGCRAVILKGVRIGRGAVVGAGAVVTKDVPQYGLVAGVPARLLGWRFTMDEVLEHERILYPAEERLTQDCLGQLGIRVGHR